MASIIAKKEKTYRTPIYAVFFILFGATLLAISIKEINTYSYKNNNYIRTEAKVIKHTYKNGKVDSSILEYVVGEDHYTTSSNNRLDCIKSYGSVVNIKYNPNNPEEIVFSDRSINIVLPITALVILSTGLSITIVMLSDSIRRIKKVSRVITSKTNQLKENNTNITTKNYVGLNDIINKDYNNINNSNSNSNSNSNNNSNNDNNSNNGNTTINSNSNVNDNIVNTDNSSSISISNVIVETDNEEQVHKEEIVNVPFISNDTDNQRIIYRKHDNASDNIDYMKFISDVNAAQDTLNFIPNVDVLKEKKQ